MTSIFGPLLNGEDVRAAAEATIRLWADTYLAEVGRQKSLTLAPIRSYSSGAGPSYPVDTLPACVLVSPGISGQPERRGDGMFDVEFELGVGVVVSDPLRDAAITTGWAYETALRALIVQNASLGGFAEETTWVYSDVNQIGWDTERVVAAASLVFGVKVKSVLNRFGGLPTPPADPDTATAAVPVASIDITTHRT